jgi:formylmethanofuran dehydrogenase subunit E
MNTFDKESKQKYNIDSVERYQIPAPPPIYPNIVPNSAFSLSNTQGVRVPQSNKKFDMFDELLDLQSKINKSNKKDEQLALSKKYKSIENQLAPEDKDDFFNYESLKNQGFDREDISAESEKKDFRFAQQQHKIQADELNKMRAEAAYELLKQK